jgi:Leucine-rich repeat (LRR) protein
LVLKKALSNIITRNLTKTEAAELIISLIESSEKAADRVACIDSLVQLNIKNERINKFLEYTLISDTNPEVREASIKGIVNNFNEESTKKLFEWVLQNENSIYVLKSVFKSLDSFNNDLSKYLEKVILSRYSKMFNIVPEEARFFWDLDLLRFNKNKNVLIGGSLVETSNSSKLFGKIPKNFLPNTYKPYFITKNRQIYLLNLAGYDLENIPDSVNLLSNLNSLNLSFNKLGSIQDSVGLLSKLRYLNLAHNRITSVPISINSLPRLKYFNLSFNPIRSNPKSLLKLAKQKFSRRYIWSGVVPDETPILGLLEILTGFQLSKVDKHQVFDITQDFSNSYKINDEGHITGICMYDGELNTPIISIIPDQICTLKYLKTIIIPPKKIEFIPNCIRNLISFSNFETRYINR